MHATLIALGFKLGDMPMWQRFFHSKLGLMLASVLLGIVGTLGFAPYQLWVITLVTLGFEFFFVATLKTPKQAFWSLWLYFTALNSATLSWLNFVMNGFGQMPLPLSWLLEILLSAYLAFFHGLLGCLAFKLAHRYLKNHSKSRPQVDDDEYADENDEDEDAESDDEIAKATDAKSATADDKIASNDVDLNQKAKTTTKDNAQDSKSQANPQKAQGILHFYKNAFLLAFLPVALILADYISGWLFTGFPWMYVGYTALEGPFSAYAPLLGVRGITLIMFICAGALALTLERRYVYLPVAGILFAIGIFCQGLNFTQNLPDIKITGVQGNVLQQIKWDPRQVIPIIDLYLNHTMPYFGKSDLIIWPESALPVFAQEIQPLLQDLNTISYGEHTPLLTGLQHADFTEGGAIETFNTIYLLGAASSLDKVQIYKKRQLVPFGEQVPFEKYTRKLGSIFNFPMSGFTAGEYKQSQIKLTLNATHASTAQPTKAQGTSTTTASVEVDTAQVPHQANTNEISAPIAEADSSVSKLEEEKDTALTAVALAEATEEDDDDAFIDERAHNGFVEDLSTDSNKSQKEEENAISAQATNTLSASDSSIGVTERPDQDEFTQSMDASELALGESEWFNSETPDFPHDKAVPLDKPLELSFIPAICYESIFPELMTSLHDENTNGIIMVSNDSWFGNTRGPDEHLGIARMRSMEMQKPMIRVTNSGHTVLIDKTGKVVEALPQDKAAILHTDFVPNQGMTPYVRFNNIPFYVILVLLSLLGWYLRNKEVNTMQQNLEALVRP